MAQTGYTPILIYSSSTGGNAPAAGNLINSTLGSELAINITDGKLFYKDNTNAVQVIGWKVVPATAGGTGQTVYAVGDILYANSTTTLAKLSDVATGNALISGGVGVAPSWGKIGLTTHVSGTLPVANGGTNLTSFTANGVVYASSTSALATGSGFIFDGTNLGLGLSPSVTPTGYKLFEIGTSGSALYGASSGSGVEIAANAKLNGSTWQYAYGTNAAIRLDIGDTTAGVFSIRQAAAGAAGTTATFSQAFTLFASGGASLGNTTDLGIGNLYVNSNVVSGGDFYESQPTPTALTGTATLTIAQIQTNIITVTSSTAVTLTLPTGTLTDAGILSGNLPVNGAFDWSIINLGSSSGAVTISAGTNHTFVGNATLAISTSGWYRTRKTATNTYVTYRIG